jgi:NAD(P)-dependent dehydrogenase (short-subunit alcohol dehydrogenase family)
MGVALVTGATSGIGRAAALALADAGWRVFGAGRDPERGAELHAELESRDDGAFLGADLAEPGAPQALVDTVRERAGGLDLLVNNAGLHALATVDEVTEDSYDELMNVNLRAAVLLAGAAVRAMRARGGGTIVNVSSEAGLVAVPGQPVYNISKAGLVMLTRAIAVDHAADGIRAVTICPGTTRTPLVDAAIASQPDPAAHERWLSERRPLGRLGKPEEIAAAIVFAASDDAGFMTGTEVVIDGGYTAA